jgi:hypothetical protein
MDMDKRLVIVAALLISVVASSNLAWAAAPAVSLPGDYAITGGKVKVVLKVVIESKKLFDITVNFYDFSMFGGLVFFSFVDSFDEPKTFKLKTSNDDNAEPLLTGTWVQTGAKFAVTSDLHAFYESLMTSLGDLGLGMTVDVGNYSGDTFTGTVSLSKDKLSTLIKGTYKLSVYFNGILDENQEQLVDLTGTSLTISGTYVGSSEPEPLISHTRTLSWSQSNLKELTRSLAQTIRTKILDAVKK